MKRLAAVALVIAVGGTAAAQVDVPGLAKLIEKQPADMDRTTWKEKRRDAARKLAQGKDKRAVPILIRVAETETFDIIGEIAIEGLGNLGDPSAIAPLQKIANDASRDKVQRDLAVKSLAKLGATPTSKPPPGGTSVTPGGPTGGTPTGGTPTNPTGGTPRTPTGGTPTTPTGGTPTNPTGTPRTPTGGTPTSPAGTPTNPAGTPTTPAGGTDGVAGGTATGGAGAISGDADAQGSTGVGGETGASGAALVGERSSDIPELPAMSDDTIAAYDRLTFAAGTAHLGYDTVRKRTMFDADVAATWLHRVERERMAVGWDAGARVVAGFINPEGRAQTRGTQIAASGRGEARFYSGSLYGIGMAAVGLEFNYIAALETDPANDDRATRKTADLQVAIGGGYGRIIDVGGAIRVRRLTRVLDASRALGKPIDAALAKRLQLAWWALRGERSSYRALVATVAILREAGILLGEPDAGLTYEILAVLRDTQVFLRPSGFDLQLAVAEGYLVRPDDPVPLQRGRVEQVLASAGYGEQLDDDTLELSGSAHARLRVLAPDDQASPWSVGATGRVRKVTYGEHGDPFGALDLSATVIASKDGIPNIGPDASGDELGLRFEGAVGFTYWMNQASGLRLAANLVVDGGELFLGASLEASYGLLDTTFAAR